MVVGKLKRTHIRSKSNCPYVGASNRGKAYSLTSNKELPPIASCALPQSKSHLAYVLDVGLPLRLVCAIPHLQLLAIHRQLNYGVVVGKSLFVILCLLFKLLLQRLQGIRNHAPRNPHELVVFCLSLRLSFLDELLALAHLIVGILDERLPYVAHPRFKYPLELGALWIVLVDVLQPPTTRQP